jgi:hypothetical protein
MRTPLKININTKICRPTLLWAGSRRRSANDVFARSGLGPRPLVNHSRRRPVGSSPPAPRSDSAKSDFVHDSSGFCGVVMLKVIDG